MFSHTCPHGGFTFLLMIKIKKKMMETRMNVIGYHISSSKRIYLPYFRLIDFKALIKVLKGDTYLKERRLIYFKH